jgi:hypothetical protein
MQTARSLVTNFAVKSLSGTSGPLDRDFDLQITEAEVRQALQEVRAAKAGTQDVLGRMDDAVFEGPAKDRDAVIARVKRTLARSGQSLQQTEAALMQLLEQVQSNGGSWAYLGAEFGARFGREPLAVQRVLAAASGWFGLNTLTLGRLESKTASSLEREIETYRALQGTDIPGDWAAKEQEAIEALERVRGTFAQARTALKSSHGS